MVVVVNTRPLISTDIAKSMTAATSHMVAPLVLRNNKFAFFALTIMQVTLKVLEFMSITISIMGCQQTIRTKAIMARITSHGCLGHFPEGTLTYLSWTYSEIRIFGYHEELMNLFIVFLYVQWQSFKEGRINLKFCVTFLIWALNFLKILDFIDRIVMKTGLAIVSFMLAFGQMDLFFVFRLENLALADLTESSVLYLGCCLIDCSPDGTPYFRFFEGLLLLRPN